MATVNPSDASGKDAEASADEYTKGLPKRGAWKIALLVVLAIAAIGFFLLPDGGQEKPKPSTAPVSRPQADTSSAVARDLKNEASNMPAPVASAPANPSVPKYSPPIPPPLSGRNAGQADFGMTKEELSRLRLDKAAASPMEAVDVVLPNNRESSTQLSSQERAALQASNITAQAEDATARALSKYGEASRVPTAVQPSARRSSGDELFLNQYTDNSFGDAIRAQPPISTLAISPGTIVRLALLRGINTDSPGQITAQVVSNVYDSRTGQILLIPMGSRVIGIYNSEFTVGQRRVVMAMTRLDLPNGVRVNLAGSNAADIQGYSGLEADVDNHYFSIFGSSLLVGAASLLLPKEQQSVTTTATAAGSETSGGIFGRALNSVAEILAARNKITRPTGKVEPGTVFSFSTVKELVLEVYK
jgi:type IV secretion system protein TrbI